MIVHEITLDGYAAQCDEQPIRLGTEGSYGVETLRVMRKGEWVDYDIIIAFHPPKGDAVQMRLGADNSVSVPAEATASAGTGELTFAGYTDGVRQISVSQIYRVAATAGVSGTSPAEPTPDIVQQILSAASNAEEIAQSVRDDADAGKFNGAQGPKGDTGPQGPVGPQGPKGDTGPAVALDTTLTHEGEAADAKATGDAISAVKARQNILVGSETGNPIVVDDAFAAPLCGLTVYGKSTQDGTPTPDAPVPIVSAGDGGTIAVTLSDGNGKTQTLTLPTPTGLPGIPVDSGGNYTDPQGQQWVCDEADLGKEIYIKRVAVTVLTVDMIQSLSSNTNDYCIVIKPPIDYKYDINIRIVLMSNRFRYDKQIKNNGVIFGYGNQIRLYVDPNKIKTLDAAKEFIEKNQIEIMYEVNEHVETPLTPAELADYKALTTYAPDTVVQASDGAGIRLDYQRDVNLVVKKLEDAIASMTTTNGIN